MTSSSNRKRSWLALLAMGGLLAAYAYSFYLPNNQRIAELKEELAEAERQAAGAVPLISAIDATQKQLDATVTYNQAWEGAAPSEYQLAEVFERLHNLTRLAETETTRFEPQSVVPYETFLRIPVSIECRGDFARLTAVLGAIENMREPIWLRSVELRSTGQDNEIAVAELSLDIFADNLEDSDQENLSGKPITQEADPIDVRLEKSGIDL